MMTYAIYWKKMIQTVLSGSLIYFAWILFLSVLALIGAFYYYQQFSHGLMLTNLSQEVSWGAYIGNFSYLIGLAAFSVFLVSAAYVYNHKAINEVVLLGQLLAFSALVMCLLFITVDLGRPDRFLHIVPMLGRLNFPQSILAWDVIVLNGYLFLNMHIPGHLLFCMYRGKTAQTKFYMPFVYLSIVWAIGIQTVSAFLYFGLVGRPFWNSAILAPRFFVGAWTYGPAFFILAFSAINRFAKDFQVKDEVFEALKKILSFTMPLNLFLLFCEVFKEFYTDNAHTVATEYLFFGLHGHNMLVPYIWSAIALNLFSATIYLSPLKNKKKLLLATCILTILGTWIEKGIGLVIPAFVPSSLGSIVEYSPSLAEFWICLGIWATGLLLFTVFSKVCIAIMTGEIKERDDEMLPQQQVL